MRRRAPSLTMVTLLVTATVGVGAQRPAVNLEALPYAPRTVVCYRASSPLTTDGKLDEASWLATPWSAPFVDIDGVRPVRHATRMKLLWDDEALYIAAQLDEPDLWATITTRARAGPRSSTATSTDSGRSTTRSSVGGHQL